MDLVFVVIYVAVYVVSVILAWFWGGDRAAIQVELEKEATIKTLRGMVLQQELEAVELRQELEFHRKVAEKIRQDREEAHLPE